MVVNADEGVHRGVFDISSMQRPHASHGVLGDPAPKTLSESVNMIAYNYGTIVIDH